MERARGNARPRGGVRALEPSDLAIHGFAVLAAASSIVFALYMIAQERTSPKSDVRIAHHGVESPFERHIGVHAPRSTSQATAPEPADADPITTASTGPAPEPSATLPGALETGPTPAPSRSYSLRGVSDGLAIVEGRERLWQVREGAILPGAGKVVAITRMGGRWVIVTPGGVIE